MHLATARDAPSGMVRVIAPRVPVQTVVNGGFHSGITFRDFWIDRREVTNRQFAAFVDAGGYRNPAFWKHPFVTVDAKVVAWVEAMTHFQTRLVGRGLRPGYRAGTPKDRDPSL